HYVTVNGSDPIVLADKPWTLAEHGPGVAQYELTLADGVGDPVLRIVRRFELDPQSYDLRLNQRFVNLTDGPLRVTLRQWLQGDIDQPTGDYMGDQRKIVTAYFDPAYDAATVFVKNAFLMRHKLLEDRAVWPNSSIKQ